MNVHYYRLNAIHAKFFIQPPAGLADDVFYARQCTVVLKLPIRIGTIRYTTNGDEPSVNATEYKQPIVIQNSALIRAITVLPGGFCSPVVSGKCTREALHEPISISNAVQGLQMKLYIGEITGLDSFSTLKLKETRLIEAFRLPEGCPVEFFGLEFIGFIQVPENGVYAFNLSSDDGSRLYIGNELLIDYDGVHGANWKTGKIALKKGFHPIHLIFFQNKYGKSLNLEYSGPGIRKQEVPATALFSLQTK
jgi:hexosaminidase